MARFVWNKIEKCRVPYNPKLDVDGNPNLEWRQEDAKGVHITSDSDEETTQEPIIPEMSVMEAIALLNPDDVTHWTKAGLPNANALSELVGRKVDTSERNDAWAQFQEEMGEA